MKKETTKTIKGFKGFDKDLKCAPDSANSKQYEENKEYEEPDAKICSKGLHFCEYPLDVLNYYPAAASRFAVVEGSGKIDKKESAGEDTKVACTHLKIGAEITLHSLINAAVSFVFERTVKSKEKYNTEDKKQCSNSGYSGAASNSGDRGAAFTIGSYSTASTNAEQSAAIAVGYSNKAKASIGSWIVIAERNDNLEILK